MMMPLKEMVAANKNIRPRRSFTILGNKLSEIVDPIMIERMGNVWGKV